MPKQNLKKEIEKHLYMILNLAGVKKSIADKIVPIGAERIMDDVVREAFERFIEETTNIGVGNDYNMNWLLKRISQKQAKWLKENLN